MISINKVPQTSMDIIRLILINQMELKQDRVLIYDENLDLPNDPELFLTVEYRNSIMIANRNIFDTSGDVPIECQQVYMLESIVVGLLSRNLDAQLRKDEVAMAIKSQYAQLMQEQFSFRIGRSVKIDDLSALEATAMLKRYDVEIMVYAWYQKTVTPGYMIGNTLQIIANDRGIGEIKANVTQLSTLPTL